MKKQTKKQIEDAEQNTTQARSWRNWLHRHKKLIIASSVIALLLLVLTLVYLIPSVRYALLSPFVAHAYTVTVQDAQGGIALQGAEVVLAGQKKIADKAGRAEFESVAVGIYTLEVTAPLYASKSYDAEVTVFGGVQGFVAKLHATGKRVAVSITDRISGHPLKGATILAGKTTTATQADGMAQVIVPTNTTALAATIKKEGYLDQALTVSQQPASASLVKTGKMYFLSKQSGTIDVVSTNLDGSDRQTLVKGTGNESEYNTALLASRDWRYLALIAKRDTPQNSLYLIDTQQPNLKRITDGTTFINPVGWSGQRFVYKDDGTDESRWSLKSVNASTRQLATLEKYESTIETESGYVSDMFIGSPYILEGDTIVYTADWSPPMYGGKPASKQSGVISVQADGSNRHSLRTYPASEISYIETKLYKPQEIHYRVINTNGERRENIMTVNKKIEVVPPAQQKFDQEYPTFLISPDGKRAFWAEPRDGKNALFTGDNNAGNTTQIAQMSEYTAYGWLTDDYVLLQKGGSELFITTIDQLKAGKEPLKISDYHKPATSFLGYGYGYGGL